MLTKSLSNQLATTDDQLSKILLNHFQNLFKAAEINISILDYIQVNFLSINNQNLVQEDIIDEDIYIAIKQFGVWKAPGLDTLQTGFYKEHWNIISLDVLSLVYQLLVSQYFGEHINTTELILIPKVKIPILPSNFRPISLCSVIYKQIE